MDALDLLCFGEALVDLFPLEPGGLLEDTERFERHLGGAPANVAVVASRLGVRSGLCTLVGDDPFGRFLRRRLSAEGVDVAAVGNHPSARTGVTFVAVAADGARSFLFYRHPSADQLIAASDLQPGHFARARVVHFGSSTLAREPARGATRAALALARRAGAWISLDPNWRPHLWSEPSLAPQLIGELVAAAALVKVADDELLPLVGTGDLEAGAARLRLAGAGLVVVTRGAKGCYFDAGSCRGEVPGAAVEVVDTTGAGDAFVAGLWAALLPRLGGQLDPAHLDEAVIRGACAFANQVAAQAVTRLGATAGVSRMAVAPGAAG